MKVALFQFATNAVGRVPAVVENMLFLLLFNALEKALGLAVVDLAPPPREGEIVSLTSVLPEKEVREASLRVGADVSIWGDIKFGPEGRPVIQELEVTMLACRSNVESPVESRCFHFDALRGDLRSTQLSVEVPALEDLVEEMILVVADMLGRDRDEIQLNRIGEGLTHSDRALTYLVYALRITVKREAKVKLYRKAISADPSFALAYVNAAQLLLGEGRFGEAMRLLLRAEANLRGSEMEPDILNLLGVSAMHLGMWDEAVKVWKRSLTLRPHHVEALCNLASAHYMRQMAAEAEDLYRQALSHRDDYPLAWFSLGRLLAREGRYEEAEGSMRRYIELCPGDPWAYYILGTCLAGLGKEEEARFALAKAAQLDPDGEAGNLARRELQQIRKGEDRPPQT